MRAKTHYTFSVFSMIAAGVRWEIALITSVFSLLPDIDYPKSVIGRFSKKFSYYLLNEYGHRTLTHSIFSVIVVGAFLSPLITLKLEVLYFCLFWAYISHILLDIFTREGVYVFFVPYKLPDGRYFGLGGKVDTFGNSRLRFKVGSFGEHLLFLFLFTSTILAATKNFSVNEGYIKLMKMVNPSPVTALHEFRENQGYVCMAKVTYRDDLEKRSYTEDMLILDMNSNNITVEAGDMRKVIQNTDIENIQIRNTNLKIGIQDLSGTDLGKLSEYGKDFFSGRIEIESVPVGYKFEKWVNVIPGKNKTVLELKHAKLSDFKEILFLPEEVNRDMMLLEKEILIKTSLIVSGSATSQLANLRRRHDFLEKQITGIDYINQYALAMKLDKELKEVKASIQSLEVQQAAGHEQLGLKIDQAVSELKFKLENLKKFRIYYDLKVYSYGG